MIAWVKAHRRSAVLCGLTLLLPLLLYLKLVAAVWGLQSGYSDTVASIEPRIARMQGLLGVESELRQLYTNAEQMRSRLVYPSSADPATVAASLQSDVRRLMIESGLSVSDSQVLPVREADKFDYIGVKLTVAGDMASLDRALEALSKFKPLVIVESLQAWPVRKRASRGEAEEQNITASLRLLSLRALI